MISWIFELPPKRPEAEIKGHERKGKAMKGHERKCKKMKGHERKWKEIKGIRICGIPGILKILEIHKNQRNS